MEVIALAKMLAISCLLPPGGLVLLVLFAILLSVRWPWTGRAFAGIGAAGLALASMPMVAAALVSTLDDERRFDAANAFGAGAIVILGGGVRDSADEYGGDTLGHLTLERVRYGAQLARRTHLPVLVTGGRAMPSSSRSEADLMRDTLEHEFRVPVRWVEARARNTRENARYSAAQLRMDGIDRVVLVLHGFDVRRARAEFEAAGLYVAVAPTLVPRPEAERLLSWLPSVQALEYTHYATYEWLALLVRAV